MKRLIAHAMSCAALSILCLALPLHAAIIEFSSTGANPGDLTLLNPTGANDPVEGLGSPSPDVPEALQDLTVSGVPTAAADSGSPYTSLFMTEVYSPDTLTITGNLSAYSEFSNVNSSSDVLVTIVFSSAGLTADATSSSVSLNFPTNVVSITLGSLFAADLGLPTSLAPADLVALTGTGGAPVASGNYNLVTGSLELNTTAPEPGSWLMAALGLGLMFLGARRKLSKVQ